MARVRVVEVVRETADAHSLVLEPLEGDRFDYRPGQFLTVRVPSERPGGAARCYSLCSSPVRDDHLKVTVKRTRDGYASNWLCDNVVTGCELEVLPPAGTFVPRDLDTDFLLLAGGSGITPVLSILKTALHAGTVEDHIGRFRGLADRGGRGWRHRPARHRGRRARARRQAPPPRRDSST